MRILLAERIEDEYPNAVEQLEEAGHEVILVTDGMLALDALEAMEKPYYLLIVDFDLPTLTGIDLVRRLRQDERFIDKDHLNIVVIFERGNDISELAGLQAAGFNREMIPSPLFLAYVAGVGH
jgi:CheY-like chemotaxis protein